MAHDWESYGIGWSTEPVSKREGPNDSDKVEIRSDAEIPVVTDLDKAREHFGDEPIKGGINGTSWRVTAQRIGRSKKTLKGEELREAVYNSLRGIRSRGVQTTVKQTVYALPNGTMYEGNDEVEYQQLYAAALVDAGVPADVATAIASAQHLA